MSADDVLNYGADRVVLATGSHWAATAAARTAVRYRAPTTPWRTC